MAICRRILVHGYYTLNLNLSRQPKRQRNRKRCLSRLRPRRSLFLFCTQHTLLLINTHCPRGHVNTHRYSQRSFFLIFLPCPVQSSASVPLPKPFVNSILPDSPLPFLLLCIDYFSSCAVVKNVITPHIIVILVVLYCTQKV